MSDLEIRPQDLGIGGLFEEVRDAVIVAEATIAEGVETAGQLGRVRELGCDLAQGDHFSGALPGEAAGALLETLGGGAPP